MSSINNINTSVLDGIIIGRVEPHIYVFITGTVPNYIKVGDTYRPVGIRLEEWKRHYDDPKRLWDDVAKVDGDTYFRDHAVHKYFIEEEKRERLKKEDLPEGIYYSNEFFRYFDNENAPDVVKKAINFIKESYVRNEGKYSFFKFDESRIPIAHTYERKENYEPRPNQKEAIKNFMSAIDNGRTNLLMYAVMRFGKSFTSMCCATEMKANVVVIVSAKADVEEEWKKTVESHERFEKYVFMNSLNLAEGHTAIKKRLDEGKNVAIFLTLQDLQGTKVKEKHKELFETCIDLLIIDETHFGARGEKYGAVLRELGVKKTSNSNKDPKEKDTFFLDDLNESIKALNSRIRLHLSGTPYRILMGDEFKPEDIIAFFQFSDISDAQDKWDEENRYNDKVNEWDNPYFGFPQMVRFAFRPNKSSREKLEELKKSGITYAFSALFHPKSIEKDDEHQSHKIFQHAKEILDLFEVIDGSKSEEGMLSFLDYDKIKEGKMCRHIVCVLPFRASCDALEKLIKDNKEKFKNLNQYEIINIAGLDIDKQYEGKNGARNIKLKIKSCERDNKKTLTLTVNRMLTGSTVEEWDTMLYLKDTASPQEYDQAIFRLQNQYIKTYNGGKEEVIKRNMKPQTLLVDFDPNRMFVMQENKSQIYNVNTDKNSNTQLEERIRKELEISPIVTINKNKIEKVEPTNILDAVREYSKDKSVVDEAKAIPIDFSLLDIEEVRKEIEKQAKLDSKEGLKISPTEGEGTDLDTNDSESKDDKSKDDGTSKLDSTKTANEEDNLRKKFATYYSRILFFAFLTNDHIISLKELIEKIENGENNKRIAKNIGLNIDILKLIQKNINPFISRDLDYKIQNLNTLANDKDVEPIKRAEVAMKKFGRLSESEIVTPEKIADDMVGILPEEGITKDTKILDIASKQGEFVYAIYKKYGKSIADNFYSIPTSEVAYEFTRKVYEFLSLDVSHIESQHNSYELIEEEKSMIKEKKIKINNQEIKFDVVVSNPPYQEMDGGAQASAIPIYHRFVDSIREIMPNYISMIIPARWYSGGRGLNEFRASMLKDRRISILHDFINGRMCFPNVEIKGGVCYFLWNKNWDAECAVFTHSSQNYDEIQLSSRYLNEDNDDIFIREPILLEIKRKLQKQEYVSFSTIVSEMKPYGLRGDFFKNQKKYKLPDVKTKCTKNSITIWGLDEKLHRIKRYVPMNYPLPKRTGLEAYKIFIPRNFGTGQLQDNVFTTIKASPNEICTETFVQISPFSTYEEMDRCDKYIKTKFVRAVIGIRKQDQGAGRDIYRFVPLQDFTNDSDIDWNQSIEEINKQLYKKYGLNDDEIQFIEKMIKPL